MPIPAKILVVDDQQYVRHTLRSLLAELTGKAARAVPVTHDSQREAERVHA